MRKLLSSLLLLLGLVSCAPKHDDPPVYGGLAPLAVDQIALMKAMTIQGKVFKVADTHSMEPFLWSGDRVVVDTHAAFKSLTVGQIIVYQATWSDVPVCHRISSVESYGLIVTGDNNKTYENGKFSVKENQFVGRVVAVYTSRKV